MWMAIATTTMTATHQAALTEGTSNVSASAAAPSTPAWLVTNWRNMRMAR